MKILYVGHTYTVSANHAKIRALAAQPNVEIALVTPQGWRGPLYTNTTDRLEAIRNVHHHVIPALGLGKEGAYVYHPRIGKLVRDVQPDIIHVEQGAYALSYTQVLIAARRHAPDARAVFFTWWNLPYEARGIKGATERYNLRHSAGAIAGNADAEEILRAHGFDGDIVVLPQLGVEVPSEVDVRRRDAATPLVIGYVGRVEPEKGVLDLLDAVLRMKQPVRLVVVGAGSALGEMKKRAANSGRIEFRPAIRNEEVPAVLSTLDVLVLPSKSTPDWVEQFGHILIEAMAEGVAVVGSSSGEIPNVIGTAGRIFREGDVPELANTLDELASNESLRLALALAGVARVRERFSNASIAEKQFAFYGRLLESPRTVGANLIQGGKELHAV